MKWRLSTPARKCSAANAFERCRKDLGVLLPERALQVGVDQGRHLLAGVDGLSGHEVQAEGLRARPASLLDDRQQARAGASLAPEPGKGRRPHRERDDRFDRARAPLRSQRATEEVGTLGGERADDVSFARELPRVAHSDQEAQRARLESRDDVVERGPLVDTQHEQRTTANLRHAPSVSIYGSD